MSEFVNSNRISGSFLLVPIAAFFGFVEMCFRGGIVLDRFVQRELGEIAPRIGGWGLEFGTADYDALR
jgi:hypothetical protein